jgi:hypothetical protein
VLWIGVSTIIWKTNIAAVMTKWPAGVRCEIHCRRSLLPGGINGSVDAHILTGGVVRAERAGHPATRINHTSSRGAEVT